MRRLLLEVFESLLELINASACIDKLLLTGEEGMALGANFNSDLGALGGLRYNGFTARASDYALYILGLDSFFHFIIPHKIISLLVGSDFTSRVIISLFFCIVKGFLRFFCIFFADSPRGSYLWDKSLLTQVSPFAYFYIRRYQIRKRRTAYEYTTR